MSNNLLEVKNLSIDFAGFKAVNNCSFQVKKGSITGLIGPNGAGKTTLFQLICGVYPPSNGQIIFKDQLINSYKSFERFHLGMARTFQIPHEFKNLSVLENLMMVPSNQIGEKLIANWLWTKKVEQSEKKILKKALETLEFLELTGMANHLAGSLSGGQKKLLELARTMMSDADLVLLDEVAAGVNRTLLRKLEKNILKLNKQGYTFLLIEHDMLMVKKLCNPVICMAEGALIAQGSFEEVINNQKVKDAYLGDT